MSKTLSTFMAAVAMMIILSVLYYGISYQSIKTKHQDDNDVIDSFQIEPM